MLIIFQNKLEQKPKKEKKQNVKNYWDLEIQKAINERNSYEYGSPQYNLKDDLLKDLYEQKRLNTPKKEDHTKEWLTFLGVIGAAAIGASMDWRKQNIEIRGQNLKREIAYVSWEKNLNLESCDRMVFNQAERLSK